MWVQRSLVILIGVVVALLLAGGVFAVVASRQPEASFPPGSPEETVATYLRLLQDGRLEEAHALTAFEQPREGHGPGTREGFVERFERWSETPHRVTLLRASTAGDSATVTVEISAFRPGTVGGPFSAPESTAQQTFTLVRRDGAWRITGPTYLYP
jgi:hypothetical protein